MKTSNYYSRLIILAALLFMFGTQSNAQDSPFKRGEFGVRFMPTFSSFDMKNSNGGTVSGEGTLGLGFGVYGGYSFTRVLAIQTEVIYSSITQKYKETDTEYKVNLRYVNVPLLFSINTGKSKTVNFNVVVGPQIGISAGSRLLSSQSDTSSTAHPILSVKAGDIGLAYGAGLDFGLNKSKNIRMGIGFRGVYGLLDISKNNGSTTTDNYYVLDKAHVKTYAAYIGFSILF